MFYPQTLSKDLKEFIKSDPNPSHVVLRFENEPQLLLKFLAQSAMSRMWFSAHFSLVHKLVFVLSKMIVSHAVSWDMVLKVIRIMIKNNLTLHAKIMREGMDKNSDYRPYISLIHAANCPSESRVWHLNATRVGIRGPDIRLSFLIYQSFFTYSFFDFYMICYADLLDTLVTCKRLEYQQGIFQLESIALERINSYTKALSALSTASLHRFQRLYDGALSYIKNFSFFYEECGGKKIYRAVCLSNQHSEHASVSDFIDSLNELSKLGYGCKISKALSFQVFQLEVENEAVEPSMHLKYEFFSSPRKKEPIRFEIKPSHLMLNCELGIPLTEDEILGLMIAYDFIGIEQACYPKISIEFLKKLSKIKPDLDYLSFAWCDTIDEEVLKALPRLFRHLGRLCLTSASISSVIFSEILKLEKLDTLELQDCILAIPDEIPMLRELETLYLIDITIEKGSLLTLFNSLPSVTVLSIIDVKELDLTCCPNADKLVNLAVSAFQLIVNDGVIQGLEKFKSLKELTIDGKVSSELKQALRGIIEEKKIIIKFSGTN